MANEQMLALLGAAGSDVSKEVGLPLDPEDRKAVIAQMHAMAQRMGQMQSMGPSAGSLERPEGLGGIQGPMTGPQVDLSMSPLVALLKMLQNAPDEELESLLGRKFELRGRTNAVGVQNPTPPTGGGGIPNAGGGIPQGDGGLGPVGNAGGFGDVSPP